MAFKRALVVDDSPTARQSLARLLAQYDLEVAFAETGEDALGFLQHELVDVIFMDHTMPGMDGLEAVSAIKGNPRTAMIPVMMYTTKEGELYVSQARALGAVGVLPKAFQPGVLYDMLDRLGLVADRRSGDAPPKDAPRRRLSDLADDVDREYEQRALGVSVQTQVNRILEEQHLKLRADILASEHRIARQVVADILEQRAPAGASGTLFPVGRPTVLAAVTAALAAALVVMGAYTWHLMAGRDAALLEVARLTNASRHELDALAQRNDGLAASLKSQDRTARAMSRAGVESVEWSLNQSPLVGYDELPFGDDAATRLDELLARLATLDFHGRVLLTARLAPFCLSRDPSGRLVPAAPDLPVDACEVTGHPLADAGSIEALQSASFAATLANAGRFPGITVALAVRGPDAADAVPSNLISAGDWNRIAALDNRVDVTLTPDAAGDLASRH